MKGNKTPIVVISGAIGSGKGTVIHALTHELSFVWVPTHTTRIMRRDDPALSRRIFDTESTFLRYQSRGEFIETVEKGGHRYGLLRADIDKEVKSGRPIIIELTVEGGLAVAREFSHVFLIFLFTNENIRRERIAHRSQNKHEVELRMQEAKQEERIAKRKYHYLIENIEHHPEEAIDTVKNIVLKRFPELKQKAHIDS